MAKRSYATFTQRNAQFLAAGRLTPEASAFYHRYSIQWTTAWANLAQLANNNVTITGTPREVWNRPANVTIAGDGSAAVLLRRCVDESGLVVRQRDRTIKQPQLRAPHVYRVQLLKRAGEKQWRAGEAKQGVAC